MRAFAALSEIFLACAKLLKKNPALKPVACAKTRIHFDYLSIEIQNAKKNTASRCSISYTAFGIKKVLLSVLLA
jgi:hypothetical protein